MSSIWEEIGNIEPDLMSPSDVIKGLFKPLREVTKDKVDFRLQKVNFFPEEVRYTTPRDSLSLIRVTPTSIFDEPKKLPHPEFGYDPEIAKAKESFRYRLLLFPKNNSDFEVELLKYKFPLDFYPIKFFVERSDFPELADYITSSGLTVGNEADLRNVIAMIIKSNSTLNLIKRLMAL